MRKLSKATKPKPSHHPINYPIDTELIESIHKEVAPSIPANARRVGMVIWYEDDTARTFFGVHVGKTFHHINPAIDQILHMYPDEGDPGYHGPLYEGEYVERPSIEAIDKVIDEIGSEAVNNEWSDLR